MKLANQAVATTGGTSAQFAFGYWIRELSSAGSLVGSREIAMIVRGFERCSANNESEQHNRQCSRKRGTERIQLVLQLSSHVFERCVRVLTVI
jgi:hypothetical protein